MTSFSLKRKNGRKKAKLPADQQLTGSVNPTGKSDKRPPIYFDHRVKYRSYMPPPEEGEVTPSSTGISPVDLSTLRTAPSRDIPFEQRVPQERDRSRKYDHEVHDNRERQERIATRERTGPRGREAERGREGDREGDRDRDRDRGSSAAPGARWGTSSAAERERSWDRYGDDSRAYDHRSVASSRDWDWEEGNIYGPARRDSVERTAIKWERGREVHSTSHSHSRSAVAEEEGQVSWSIDTTPSLIAAALPQEWSAIPDTAWSQATAMMRQLSGAGRDAPPVGSARGTSAADRGGRRVDRSDHDPRYGPG